MDNNKKNDNFYLYVIALIIFAGAVAFIYFKFYKDEIKINTSKRCEIQIYEEAEV